MRKIKNTTFLLVLVTLCLFLFPVTACAEEGEEPQSYADSVFSELYDGLAPQIKEELDKIGLQHIDTESLLTLSPKRVFEELISLVSMKMGEPLKALGLLCGCLIVTAVTDAFVTPSTSMQGMFSLFTTLFSLLCLLKPILSSVTAAFSSMQLSSAFLFSYIPIFTGLLLANGKMLTSATYSSMMLGLSNVLAVGNTKLFLPLTESILLLNVASGIQEKYVLTGFSAFLKKCITMVLAFSSTIFSGLLAIKGNLALAGDTLAIRGVKMVIGSAVPVVGGSLSDACNSLLGSLALMKSSVGAFGILVISLVHLPVILDLLLWNLALSLCAAVADALGQSRMKNLLTGFASTVALVNTLVVFTAFLLIISTGILFRFKN